MKTINSLRSKLLALTLALMASVSAFAYEFEYVNDFHVDGFAYKVLPPTMEAPFGNVALIEIADCTEDVVIPGTVTHDGVTYIVTTLGGGATLFTNSAKEIVKSVFIPKKISTINSPLFADCSNLTSIVVDSRNSYYDSRENCNAIITTSQNSFFTPNMLIAGCKTTTIPNSVTEIADKAFYRSAIESITIPTGVTKIGHSAFNQATLLSSIKLPITLTEIGDWAFADCLNLNTISCYALEPPTISGNTFFGSNPIYNNPSVYVPAYCIEAYKNAEHWIWFTQILPINEPAYKDRWCDTWNVLTIKRELETWQYNLAHDTIIDDYTYTAVTRHTTKVPAGVYPIMAPEPEYVAAVRFTEDKKAFIYYDNTEYLLYDFNAQPGDELTVFAGINHYRSHKTNRCRIGEVNIFPDSDYYYHREISLTVIPNYNHSGPFPTCAGITKWIEGVGDICGLITGADCGLSDDQSALLCAYKDGNTKYTTEEEEYAEYGCEYNSGENKEYILTLPGLQRTHTVEMYDYAPNDGKRSGGYPLPFASVKDTVINGKTYLQFGDYVNGSDYSLFFLREENNKVLIYSSILQNDLVLYDYTLELGDSLPAITSDHDYFSDDHFTKLDKAKDIFTYVVTDVSTVTLLDGIERKKWILKNKYLPIIEYVEGIGCYGENTSHSGDFFRLIYDHPYTTEYVGDHLVCVSKNGQLLYSMPQEEMNSFTLTCECLSQEDTIAPKDLFPTLWGLQRTTCLKNINENEVGTVWGSRSYLMQEIETTTIDGKQYLLFGTNNTYDEYCSLWLREENNKILVYSAAQKKDLVLYDFTLNVGDSLPRLYVDEELSSIVDYYKYEADWEYTKPLFVTEVSTITLLDGKEYKKWTFDNGMEYVEGIGSFGTSYAWNDFYQLIANGPLYSDVFSQHLVCVSKNGQLLYQMDDTEMEQLETECLCEIEPKWSETWCNQWNILSHGYLGPQDPLAGARTSIYWLSNNTVNRNGQEYIPLMCSSSLPNEESTLLVGELRFTEDKQVYFYYAFDETEYLLYDFGAELGDTLELFAGLEFYNYHKTYTHVITDKETLDDGRLQIQADVVIRIDNGAGEYFEEKHPVTWIEGLGSTYGIIFNPSNPGVAGDGAIIMLCAYRDDECVYTTNFSDYKNMGCVYNNDGTVDEDLFPMLAGLQRTVCNEFCGDTEDDNSSNTTYKQTFDKILFERDQPYIYCNSAFLLREENNKILIYSHSLDKDLVLYDFTLEVGDSLPQLYLDEEAKKDIYWIYYEYMNVVDYNKYNDSIYPADTLIVTDVSMITLLDGKEYKKWTFNNGMEYVEGIGMYGGRRNGNFFGLIQEVVVPCHIGTHLVCASKNGKLLYQMDEAEMERLGTECLCAQPGKGETDDAKDGQIGGRPTPTQWYIVEINQEVIHKLPAQRSDENNSSILSAETYIYTLENDSLHVNGKKYFELDRYSSKNSPDTKVNVGALHFGQDDKVWFYHDNTEYLLYDFSAEVGDTLQLFAGIHNYPTDSVYTHVVTAKDTIEDGITRVTLDAILYEQVNGQQTELHYEKVWLAGLGSIDGIVHNSAKRASKARNNIEQNHVMLCAWREDECLYTTDHPDFMDVGCEYNHDFTAIEDIHTSGTQYQKIIRDGHLYIIHNGGIYNVLGINIAR